MAVPLQNPHVFFADFTPTGEIHGKVSVLCGMFPLHVDYVFQSAANSTMSERTLTAHKAGAPPRL